MKMKVVLALCVFVGLAAMEDKQCAVTFHNDLNVLVSVNEKYIHPAQQLEFVLPSGKAIAVRTISTNHYCTWHSVRSLPVPIIREENKSTSCAVALSFLIKAKEDSTCEAPDNSNILFYFIPKDR
ncbi:MAG: hypothetical protein M1114_05145 [Candidatus Dependentiae bacterium]|nr:hypothetical protein [Candidatus Dependentiae bacterium]